jgi:hypothetical protein
MALTYKVLGTASTTTGGTALYTNATSGGAVVSSIIVSNSSTSSRTFAVHVVPTSATAVANQYCIASGTTVPANDSIIMTLGISLASGNSIKVSGSTTDVGFIAFGAEIS